MSQVAKFILAGLLVVTILQVLVLSVIVWQQQQEIAELKKSNEKQTLVISEIAEQHTRDEEKHESRYAKLLKLLQDERNEMKKKLDKLNTKYKNVKTMIATGEEMYAKFVRRALSLHTDLATDVIDFKEKHNATVAAIDHRIEESQRQTNESVIGLAKVFVEEITEWKNKTLAENLALHDRMRQLALEVQNSVHAPTMIENKVTVETNYHVQTYDSQLSLGERIGQFVGGMVETGARAVVSWLVGW